MAFEKKWTLELIRDGFQRFIDENGRQPSTQEIDTLDNLPSCRTIQRLYGGLPQLRQLLGFQDIYFSRGEHRSKIGLESNKRSRISEDKLRDILYDKFHEPFVHQEKPIDSKRKLRANFYVFNPVENFAIDIFATETFHDLCSNVYIKLRKYSHLKLKLYLVLLSSNLTEGDIDQLIKRRKNSLPENIKLYTLKDFVDLISNIPAYPDPTPK